MIGQIVGNYRIDRLLGDGRLGQIYLATQRPSGQRFVVQMVRPNISADRQFQERFSRVTQLARTLDHANVARVVDAGMAANQHFIVTQYIQGGTLRSYLKQQGNPLPLNESAQYLQQVGSALNYAHRQGMVHRHIRPENILLLPLANERPLRYRATLADFATSSLIDFIPGSQSIALQEALPYMSPERLRDGRVDGRGDIYALGMTFYEMVTGNVPFKPSSAYEALQMHTRNPDSTTDTSAPRLTTRN